MIITLLPLYCWQVKWRLQVPSRSFPKYRLLLLSIIGRSLELVIRACQTSWLKRPRLVLEPFPFWCRKMKQGIYYPMKPFHEQGYAITKTMVSNRFFKDGPLIQKRKGTCCTVSMEMVYWCSMLRTLCPFVGHRYRKLHYVDEIIFSPSVVIMSRQYS